MYNPRTNALEDYLTERGLPKDKPAQSPKQDRDDERQQALRTRGERDQQWRAYMPTVAPSATTESLQVVREACGLTQGDVASITGQAVSHVAAAERGKETVSDSVLRQFIGAATVALQNAGR